MAFGPALGFGMMQPGGSFGGPLSAQRARDPRLAIAQALMREGLDTSPIQSPWQGASRVAQAGLSGYLMGKQNEDWNNKEADYARTMANALKLAQGTPAETKSYGDGTTINWNAKAPDAQGMLNTLAGNQYTAPMAMQMQMQQIQAQQAAEAEARKPRMFSPGQQLIGPDGKVIAGVPANPEAPKTVNTAEGVFVLNRDGSLGQRLGGPSSLVTMNLPPAGYQPNPAQPGTQTFIPGGPADPAVIAAKAAAEQSVKPDAALAKAKTDFQTARDEAAVIVNALQDFKETSAKAGLGETVASATGRTTPLNTAYNKAALLAKGEQLFNLGVLNGPDLDIIRRTLPDPSTLSGATTSQKDVNSAVQQVIDLIQDRVNTKAATAKEAPSNLIDYGRSMRSRGVTQEYDYDPATKTLKPRAQ